MHIEKKLIDQTTQLLYSLKLQYEGIATTTTHEKKTNYIYLKKSIVQNELLLKLQSGTERTLPLGKMMMIFDNTYQMGGLHIANEYIVINKI